MSGPHLLITCHPSSNSLCGHIAAVVAETLRIKGAQLVVDDLTAIGFDPVISFCEFEGYFEGELPTDVALLVDHLKAAESLIFVLPIWMYTMPTRLKGWFDRVWRPHVAFELENGRIRPLLINVSHLTVIATHGMSKAECDRVGDGTRLYFETSIPSCLPSLRTNTRFDVFNLDSPDPDAIASTLNEVRRHVAGL